MNNKDLLTWDNGDFCLRTSLYYIGGFLLSKKVKVPYGNISEQDHCMDAMKIECKVDTLFHQRKSATYRWSCSDGLTRWLYDKVLRSWNIDFYKGLNFDQLRAYWLYLFITRQTRKAWKQLFGLICRGGFAPSYMEHVIMRPQSLICLLATCFYPATYLVLPFFLWRAKKELAISNTVSTTNKITLLPTLFVLGYKLPSNNYIREVYQTYFQIGSDCYIIGKQLTDAISE